MTMTYPQRIVLGVLLRGGWILPGTFGRRSARLFDANGEEFAFVPRITLDRLTARGMVTRGIGPYAHVVITEDGRRAVEGREP